MKAPSSPEGRLVDALTHFLSKRGYKVRVEVPNMGQSADVVATRGRWVTFIEVKVRDWRRALEQCRAHRQVADFICIAVGTKSISRTMSEAITLAGYGLIHCSEDGDCHWIIHPARNVGLWRPQRQKLSDTLRKISHAN